jgi:hypothetical protein
LAGYVEGEGFRIKDESGDYMLRFGFQGAYKFEPSWTNGQSNLRDSLVVLRPILRGNLYKPWITFWTSMELAGNPPYLLDSYFDVTPIPEFGMRAGQQYSLISRQEQLGPQQLFFPFWAPAAEYFWPGRDKGLQVYGFLWDKMFEYYAGVFSGTPLRQLNTIPGNYELEGRIAYNPMGPVNGNEFPFTDKGEALPTRFSIGLQSWGGRVQEAQENFNPDNGQLQTTPIESRHKLYAGGADAWFQSGPVIVSAEAYLTRNNLLNGTPDFTAAGAWGYVIVNLWKNKLAGGVEFDWVDPNTDVSSDSLTVAQAELAWFIHAPDLVLKLRYAHANQQTPTTGGVSLPYMAGSTNIVTLQFNISY